MTARYVEIDVHQMDALVLECGFMPVRIAGTRERVFQRILPGTNCGLKIATGDLAVRVYSTIPVDESVSRDVGADAIRVVLAHLETGRPVWTATRTHRTKNWRERLRERMRAAWRAASTTQRCPDCGRPMVRRESKSGGDFLGCVGFPACRGTRRAA